MEQELTSFFKQAIRTPEAHPLVLVVRRLNITEHIGGVTSEYALAELVADFYYRSTSGYYLAHHATELASSQALDVTSQHPQLISEVLLHGLASLKTWTPKQVSTDTPLTWDQVMGGSVTAHYPAQSATALRDGIYRTVADFRQNTPQEGIECKVRYSGNGLLTAMGTLPMNVKLRDASGKSLDEAQLWGFCSGTQPYIRHGNSFYPLIRTESGYEYEAPIYLDPRQRSATFTYTPVGIFSRQSPPLTAATFRVQLDTGFANDDTPVTNRADAPSTTATVIVYRRPDAVPDKAVQVRLNGQAVGSLQTGEYLSLAIPAVSQA
ncbi:MAG TPA: hypothetical protein VK364_01045, partial [Hymenobacter sp.]|nr:hypothetical protein [Hymenobacter sp.]